jgi:hypothetical protein
MKKTIPAKVKRASQHRDLQAVLASLREQGYSSVKLAAGEPGAFRPNVDASRCEGKDDCAASTPSAPNVAAALHALGQTVPVATEVGPNILSLAHWTRLLEGELYAPRARLDWQTLLKRTFDHDLRVCPRCGQRMMVRAILTEASPLAAALARVQRSRGPPMP